MNVSPVLSSENTAWFIWLPELLNIGEFATEQMFRAVNCASTITSVLSAAAVIPFARITFSAYLLVNTSVAPTPRLRRCFARDQLDLVLVGVSPVANGGGDFWIGGTIVVPENRTVRHLRILGLKGACSLMGLTASV
jgi:hypothetical protein